MKKLSLFSLFGLTGLLAFLAMPIYAQEDEVVVEDVAVEMDDLEKEDTAVDEFNYWVNEDEIALETVWVDDTVEGETDSNALDGDLEPMEDINASIRDILPFLYDEEETQDGLAPLKLRITLGDEVIVVDSFSFFLSWIWLQILIVFLVWLILCHIALWRIFWRAWEWRWKSLIPIYNLYIVFKISGIKNWFWYILLVIFIAAIISAIFPVYQEDLINFSGWFASTVILLVWFLLTKKFGRGDSASILYTMFSGIAVLILWFWNYKYQWKSEKKEKHVEA